MHECDSAFAPEGCSCGGDSCDLICDSCDEYTVSQCITSDEYWDTGIGQRHWMLNVKPRFQYMIVKICDDDKFNFSYPDFFDYCLQKLKALHELKRINNKLE